MGHFLWDGPYVIFTSDNGGGFRGNAPLRGGKARLWEGGIRVPTVICGPGVKAGVRCDVPIAGWDFFPTISDLIGSRKPLSAGIDGGSLRPLFEKGNRGRVERGTEGLIFHFPWYDNLPMSAIRLGDYKLVKDLNTGETRLFDVAGDIGENHDLSKVMPEVAEKLHAMLTDYLDAVDAETIGDMRAARKQELLGNLARTRREIEQLQQRLKGSADDPQKRELRDRLADRQVRLKSHKAAIDRLERARKVSAW